MKVIQWTKNWANQNHKPYQIFQSLQSSNKIAQTIPLFENQILLIFANQQTLPYGRHSNQWIPSDFMATWTWNQKTPVSAVISPRIGLLFHNAFNSTWPSPHWALKAPNDIYYKDKKVSGLLLETIVRNQEYQLILGVGINVFDNPLKISTSIFEHFPVQESSWQQFLNIVDHNLNTLKDQNSTKLTINEREQILQKLKRHILYKNLKSVDSDGSLIFSNKSISWKDL